MNGKNFLARQNLLRDMNARTEDLREQVVDMIPALRAFARSLSSNRATADDLVQETLLKAISNFDKFADGTNLRAWLFTILRNTFYSELRKTRNEVADPTGEITANIATHPAQEGIVAHRELEIALKTLPRTQHQALMLVGASGHSYEEAAAICGCALGTMKSRVNRGRTKLMEALGYDSEITVASDDPVLLASSQQ